jgi:RNA polymerase sigma-70 factor (ECF subfamily)
MPPPDSEIDHALADGNHRRTIELCTRAFGLEIGRFCYALLASQAEAEEAAQEVFLAAFRSLASFRGESAVRGWLFGIAKKTCAKRLEIRQRQVARKTLAGESNPDSGTESKLVRAQSHQQLRLALEQLRPTEREALTLRFEADLSLREVATALGLDEDAARKRVSRALDKLRQAMGS